MKKLSVANHVLVPKHSKVSEREKAELQKKYSITPESLPRILRKDPALLEIDVATGDIVKIVRASPTAGQAIYYRVVVDE